MWSGCRRSTPPGTSSPCGRKVPRDGGVILAAGMDRAAVERIVSEDPFTRAGVCEYRITEFVATTTAPAMEQYRERLPS